MKKIFIIIILAAVLGGGFYFYQSRKTASSPASTPGGAPAGGIMVKENNSLLGWLKKGGEADCHLVTVDSQDIIILAKGDKIRIDSSPVIYGPTADGTDWIMADNSGWVYVWNADRGAKISSKALAGAIQAGGNPAAEKFSWEALVRGWQNEKVNFKCQEAKLSDGLFLPPDNIDLVDLTEKISDLNQISQDLIKAIGPSAAATGTSDKTKPGVVETIIEN